MTETYLTKRSLLAAGGSLAGLGYVGFTKWRDGSPGAEGFTAGTAPEESDPLLVARPKRIRETPASGAVATSILADTSLNRVPDTVSATLTDNGTDIEVPRKLVAVGSNDTSGAAAIVWVDWTGTDLLEQVEATAGTTSRDEEYEGRTVHVAGETAGVTLADGVVGIGTAPVVRAIVDVWHGDASPVDDAVLHPFDRTDRTAPVRFATTGLAFHDVRSRPRTAAYEPIENTSVEAAVVASDATVELTYEVESIDATNPLASALERDLGLTDHGEPVDPTLPRGIRGDITVVPGPAIVTVEYSAAADSVAAHVDDVFRTLAAVTSKG